MRSAGQDGSSLNTEKHGAHRHETRLLLDLGHEIKPPNCMQFSCTQYSQETPAPSLAVLAPGKHRAHALRIRPATTPCLQPQNHARAAYAALPHAPFETQPKSWSIMLDFAGITPSAILVKKWRGNRCTRLSGPIFPRTLCQHRYIWKLNDYHPRQRKRAL